MRTPKLKVAQATIDKLWTDLKAAEKRALDADARAHTAEADLAQYRAVMKMTRAPIQRLYEIVLDADPAVNVFSPAFGRELHRPKEIGRRMIDGPPPVNEAALPKLTHRLCGVGGYCALEPQCPVGELCARLGQQDAQGEAKRLIDGDGQ